jgi:hypothetical protein
MHIEQQLERTIRLYSGHREKFALKALRGDFKGIDVEKRQPDEATVQRLFSSVSA